MQRLTSIITSNYRSAISTFTYELDLISAPWIEFPTNTARTILSLSDRAQLRTVCQT